MLELQVAYSLTEPSRLIAVHNSPRLPFGDRTEHAATGANITQDHEGCGSVFPAFTDIRTAGFLANGMEF
jgi:hypothetical protein